MGLGETCNIDIMRFVIPRAFSDYIAWTKEGPLAQSSLTIDVNSLEAGNKKYHDNDDLHNVVMTQLRTTEGLDLNWVAAAQQKGATGAAKRLLR